MTMIYIDQNIFYTVLGVAGFGLITTLLLGFAIMSISEIKTLIYAKFTKRPLILMHTALKETQLYTGKLEGKSKKKFNKYDLPEFGTKFTPLPEMVNHLGGSRVIDYYSKCPLAMEAKAIAAFRDVEALLKEHGITPTETILDIVITMSDEEINELYNINATSLENVEITLSPEDIMELRNTLRNQFIKDGQFVFEVAKDFVFLMQTETARSLDESIAIAREQAIEDARLGTVDKNTQMTIIYIITLLMGGGIAYKIVVG